MTPHSDLIERLKDDLERLRGQHLRARSGANIRGIGSDQRRIANMVADEFQDRADAIEKELAALQARSAQ